jgi:hypothetical protein
MHRIDAIRRHGILFAFLWLEAIHYSFKITNHEQAIINHIICRMSRDNRLHSRWCVGINPARCCGLYAAKCARRRLCMGRWGLDVERRQLCVA